MLWRNWPEIAAISCLQSLLRKKGFLKEITYEIPILGYIYIYMPDGRVSSKNGPVRGPPKSRFGDRAFSHYKKDISEEKCGNSKKGQKLQIAPTRPRALFCRNTHLNLCTGHLAAKPLWQGVALIKIGFFEVHIVQGLFACTNLKIFVCVCVINAFCLHFAKFCVLIFWNACFCSLTAFWAVRDFRPDFWPVSNLKIFVCVSKMPSFCILPNLAILSFGMPVFVV